MDDKVFTTHGNVVDEEGGEFFFFHPGMLLSDVPERLHEKFTNPKLFSKVPQIGKSNISGDSGTPDYDQLTVPQLQRLMRERGLTAASARKSDMIVALAEHDLDAKR